MKRQSKKVRFTDPTDRISDLPDSILAHIISFLCTKTAIRTSVLSKRWRLVWTHLPNLDFRYVSDRKSQSFAAFVSRVLAARDDSQINVFRFCAHLDVDPCLVEDCISYALRHHVQELKIRAFCNRRPVLMPLEFSARAKSLTVLKLTCASRVSLILPKCLAFPALKTLHLKHFTFSERNFNDDFFSGCPILQTLLLCKCMVRPHDKLTLLSISAFQLKELEILYWRCPYQHTLLVSAPKLNYFKYEGHASPLRFKEDPSCITTVSMNLSCPSACATIDLHDRRRRTAEDIIRMLAELCNVKSLTLSFSTIEILSSLSDLHERGACTLCNLRYIRITAEHKCTEMTIPINTVTYLLQSHAGSKTFTVDLPKFLSATPVQEHKPTAFGDLKYLKLKAHDRGINMTIPANALTYLLRSSPGAETLVVEFHERSSGE